MNDQGGTVSSLDEDGDASVASTAGIATGVGVGVLVALLAGGYFYRLRTQKSGVKESQEIISDTASGNSASGSLSLDGETSEHPFSASSNEAEKPEWSQFVLSTPALLDSRCQSEELGSHYDVASRSVLSCPEGLRTISWDVRP